MARKPSAEKAKTAKNPHGPRVMDDNFVAPKRRKKAEEPKVVTLAEAIAEQAEAEGKTAEQVQAELTATPPGGERPPRAQGTSNLATTIRDRRKQYQVALGMNGKKTQINGDVYSQQMLRIPLEAMAEFVLAKLPGVSYAHLNRGHQRMCLGNRIRGWAKQGDEATLSFLASAQVPEEGEKTAEG